MDRLTDPRRSRCIACDAADDDQCAYAAGEFSAPCPDAKRYMRLSAYEDTGLTPEEIIGLCEMDKRAKMADLLRLEEYQSLGDIARLRALAEADRDGRCVVLPCKVGESLPIQNTLYMVEGFLCNKAGDWKVHLTRAIPSWTGNRRTHSYMSFRAFEKKRAEAEAALGKDEDKSC